MFDTEMTSRPIRRVGNCSACDLPLPLRLSEGDEEAALWACAACDARYVGLIDEAALPHLRTNVVAQNNHTTPSQPLHLVGRPRQPAESVASVSPERSGVRPTLKTTASRQFDAEIDRGVELRISVDGPAFSEKVKQHGKKPYDESNVERAVGVVRQSRTQITDLFNAIVSGEGGDSGKAEVVARQSLITATEDLDLFAALGINPSEGDFPAVHSVHAAMLAMSIGTTLGHDEQTLTELGIGCLLHDVGMLRVDRGKCGSSLVLKPEDFAELAAHPVHTMELLSPYSDRIPMASRMVAYQMHERLNGSGYPCGSSGGKIHDLAKIAAAADVFVALVSARPHRRPMTPYHAMGKLLKDVQGGLFDAEAVRALLRTVSLFPLGSYVLLSNGRVGRVLRPNGDEYTKPVVETWLPGRYNDVPEIVDLSGTGDLKITKPLARLPKLA